MKKTKTLAVSSLMAALCFVILSLASFFESLDLSLAILSGLVMMILCEEFGKSISLTAFFAVGVLSLFLPVKSGGVLFLAIFGWYPMVQKKINMKKPFLARLVKVLLCNAVLALLLLLSAFVTQITETPILYLGIALMGNVCFFLYDILLDRFYIWYLMKLRKHLRF